MKMVCELLPDGKSEVKVLFENGDTPTRIAIQLACATRIVAKALCDALKLPNHHEEKIEAEIFAAYARDINEFGSLGERLTQKPPPEEK
jgi:hypothetical protein